MDKQRLADILQAVSKQELSPQDALEMLRHLPYEDVGFAKLDLHRHLRQGMPEVIFCPGKTTEQIIAIAQRLRRHHQLVLASRASTEVAKQVLQELPEAGYHELGKMLVFGSLPQPDESLPPVAVVTAGTADLAVAEEAAIVLQAHGVPVIRINDVGVAGIHRLLDNLQTLHSASVSIVVAGMDGALPSVIGGLLEGPVIAVPTSVGYGAAFQGLAPLLTMLNSCAAGLTVVNIDNGFGAAVAAMRLLRTIERTKAQQEEHKTVQP
ncbi:MAG TPA: nickel pincer cofactor biosynthesis protein LarB [Candidatus Obscuribacterales bacterium]